jgi:ABC-type lipoprotein release transport system permease subunit
MKPYYLISLKNIKNNRARTVVTIFLTAISTAILIFASTLMDGEHKIMLKNAVEVYPSYIQITNKKFRSFPSYDNLIFDKKSVIDRVKQKDGVSVVTSRFETSALFSSNAKTIGAMITGIEPKNESRVSKVKTALIEGSYLESNDTNMLYIGKDLAFRLQVRVGDKLSFISNGADYSFCADNVIIKGIFQTGLYEFDSNSAFLNRSYFDEIFTSKNLATHIIILPKDTASSLSLSKDLQKELKELDETLVSESWEEFMSSLLKALELDSIFGYITLGIFFIVIFFVIMIYTLLVVFSRVKEIGILRAIGTSKKQIFSMLLFESVLLSFISVVLGGLVGAYLAYYFSVNPIELADKYQEQFKQYGMMSTALPTDFNLFTIARDMLIMFILGILSTLYPIFKLNSLTPSKAMHHV